MTSTRFSMPIRSFAVIVGAAAIFTGETAMSLEQPEYTVIYKDGDVDTTISRTWSPRPSLTAEMITRMRARRDSAGCFVTLPVPTRGSKKLK